jgi:hypothetical protein
MFNCGHFPFFRANPSAWFLLMEITAQNHFCEKNLMERSRHLATQTIVAETGSFPNDKFIPY